MERATLAAGCFWGVEAAFRQVKGVTASAVGYMGGTLDDPAYEEVCSGTTGHAEVVQVDFDPLVVSFDKLLEVFWTIHDPTTLNRQGPDRGSQYRSSIFFHTAEQEKAATASKESAQRSTSGPIVTQITSATAFWPAEAYHQQYLEKRGQANCHL